MGFTAVLIITCFFTWLIAHGLLQLFKKNAPVVQSDCDLKIAALQDALYTVGNATTYLASRYSWGHDGISVLLEKAKDIADAITALKREPIADCTRRAPHACTVNGPCNGWPVVGQDRAQRDRAVDEALGSFGAPLYPVVRLTVRREGYNGRMPTKF